jgi:hypothetical protein
MSKGTVVAKGEVEARILREGFGKGAWHGPDLKAALEGVTAEVAFWRPAAGRHNIAEIALHHAYCARGVRAKLTGREVEAFVLGGEDWFELPDAKRLSWTKIREVVEREQERLVTASGSESSLSEPERFDLVLGVTCHAIYHAGQIQLIKQLAKR